MNKKISNASARSSSTGGVKKTSSIKKTHKSESHKSASNAHKTASHSSAAHSHSPILQSPSKSALAASANAVSHPALRTFSAPKPSYGGSNSYGPRSGGASHGASRGGSSSYGGSSSSRGGSSYGASRSGGSSYGGSYSSRSSGGYSGGASAGGYSSRGGSSSYGHSRSSGGYSSAPRSGGSSYGSQSGGSSYGASAGGYSSRGASSYGPSRSGGSSYGASRSGGSSYGSRGGSSYGASRSGGYGSRGGSSSSHGGYARGGSAGMVRGGGGRNKGQYIDVNRFINKIKEHDGHASAEAAKAAAPKPKHTFNDFNIAEDIKKRIALKGFVTPSPIQDGAIPYIIEGKDVVGIANTGTGKTAAFLIPLVNKVINNPKEEVLIMAPTRELAIQIEEELLVFIKNTKIYSVCCVGGAHIRKQMSELRYFNNFVIGTPGRLKDLGERKCIDFSKFTNVVLDEADRMLDMGFIADMRFMLGKMPKTRQTLFFTATMSKDIEKLIHEFLNNPITVSVKTGDTSKSVDQDVVRVERGASKIDKLHALLSDTKEFNKVLIFGQTKSGVERLTEDLIKLGHKAGSIHGDKNHYQRQKTLKNFKDNLINILVATDVAARGLDIADVSHVINYELPMTYEDYVHRIGRTGRGGKLGKALTFVAH